MNLRHFAILFLVSVLCISCSTTTPISYPQDIFSVIGQKYSGSGVPIKTEKGETYIITAEHVLGPIDRPESFFIVFVNDKDKISSGSVVYRDKYSDIAIIDPHNDEFFSHWATLDTSLIRRGANVYHMGWTVYKEDGIMPQGKVTGYKFYGEHVYRTYKMKIIKGSSGGGIFNEDHDVIGIATRGNGSRGSGPTSLDIKILIAEYEKSKSLLIKEALQKEKKDVE